MYAGAERKWQLAVCLVVAAPEAQPDNEDC